MRFTERQLSPKGSPRSMYGAEIRAQRNRAGLTLTALADMLGYAKATFSRYETGESPIPPELPPKLDAVFDTGNMFVHMFEMIKHDRFPQRYRAAVALESSALKICEYAAHTIPGLLQIPDYAEALFRVFDPDVGHEQLKEQVGARMSRQEVLARADPPYLCVVLDEAVLRRPVGGSGVMCRQLEALVPHMDTKRGTIQILPFGHGEHPLLGSALTLMALPDGTSVAYFEGSHSGDLIEDPTTVEQHQRRYDRLRSYALPPRESAGVVRETIEVMRSWETRP